MKQNSNTDILIERLKQNQYESELERRKDADALFAAGCAEDNDTWKSLALYYLASERITAQDEMTLDHLLGEDIRDKVTGLLMMRPFLHLADEENKRRKEGKKFVLLFYNILNFARYNYRFGLDEGGQTAIVRPDRTIVYWNKAAQALTGYSRGWMCGRRCNETLLRHMDEAGNDLCRSKCPFLKVLETDQPAAQNLILHKQDDGTLKVRAVFTPIRDANGTAVEVLGQFYPLEEEVHP